MKNQPINKYRVIRSFEDLEVWKRGCQLAVDAYTALHDSRDFGLKDQIQRSAVSIASNIAEGAERGSTKEYIKFLRYSRASCAELRTQFYIAQRIRRNTEQDELPRGAEMIGETKEISAMLQGLISSLENKSHQT